MREMHVLIDDKATASTSDWARRCCAVICQPWSLQHALEAQMLWMTRWQHTHRSLQQYLVARVISETVFIYTAVLFTDLLAQERHRTNLLMHPADAVDPSALDLNHNRVRSMLFDSHAIIRRSIAMYHCCTCRIEEDTVYRMMREAVTIEMAFIDAADGCKLINRLRSEVYDDITMRCDYLLEQLRYTSLYFTHEDNDDFE